MKEKCENICRVCLKGTNNNRGRKIDHILKETFDILCIKMNLDISKEPVICKDCAEKLWRAFNFKSTCVNTENCILPFIDFEIDKKINLLEVYLKIYCLEEIGDKNVCRFCMKVAGSDCSTSLTKIIEDLPVMRDLLEVYFSEMDSYSVREPFVCELCFNSLHDYLTFAINCVNTEEKIQSYIKEEGGDSKRKINLANVQQFLEKSHAKEAIHLDVAGSVENLVMNTDLKNENSIERDYSELNIKTEELEIKTEEDVCESFQDIPFMHKDSLQQENEKFVKTNKQNQALISSATYVCNMCAFHTECSEVYEKHVAVHIDHSYAVRRKENWPHTTKYKHLKSQLRCYHTHSGTAVNKYNKDNKRTYKRKIKNGPLQHRFKIVPYKCEDGNCSYETSQKRYLKRCVFIHKNPTEVTTYKCQEKSCSFETKYKRYLQKHMLIHKVICLNLFESKSKSYLQKHIFLPKDPSELTMYRCENENCLFESQWKSSLRRHISIHKNPADLVMYKFEEMYLCEMENCSYKSRKECNLKRHILVHKSPSEVTMYKCEEKNCIYETKYKRALKVHIKTHKNPPEVTTYKCEQQNCSYETKYKNGLKIHMKFHIPS